jgi:hypothetical protein
MSDTPRTDAAKVTVLGSLQVLPVVFGRMIERELAAAKAENATLRSAMSDGKVDLLDKLITVAEERDELQQLLQTTRHERDTARAALREMLTAVRSLTMPDGWPWYESQAVMLAKWEGCT